MNSELRFRINRPEVIHQAFGDELVAINFLSGNYYSVSGTGAEIWDLIEEGCAAGGIVAVLASRYNGAGEEIEAAVRGFLAQLEEEQLIVPAGGEGVTSPQATITQPAVGTKPPFPVPALSKYADMQELLLLDPIHNVDETGWPNPAAFDAE